MKKSQDDEPNPSHSHSHSPSPRSSCSCAACKLLKRRCGPSCIFAPYFRADEPNKFAKVHKVFGASNVSKLLNEVPMEHREDMVNSLIYEAESRLHDPVHGCLGPISFLYRKMVQLEHDLTLARARLAQCAAAARAKAPPIEEDRCYGCGSQGGVFVSDHNRICTTTKVVDRTFVGCEEIRMSNEIDEVANVWYGIESEGANCTQLVSLSPNNGGDFGQVPLLPL